MRRTCRLDRAADERPLIIRVSNYIDASQFEYVNRPDLSPKQLYSSQEQALRAESKKRLQLEARGYKVDGGTERLEAMKTKKSKSDN